VTVRATIDVDMGVIGKGSAPEWGTGRQLIFGSPADARRAAGRLMAEADLAEIKENL
jgi:hypothetical protein